MTCMSSTKMSVLTNVNWWPGFIDVTRANRPLHGCLGGRQQIDRSIEERLQFCTILGLVN
jgi:hypothetical protein